MEAYKIVFNIWADNEDEAKTLSEVLQKFINDNGQKGIAITASKTTNLIEKWQDSYIVKSQINQIYKQ